MKRYYEKYKHIIPLAIFGVIYVLWFYLLEHRTNVQYMVVHMNIDDYIPFCEYFVVPYLLWFAYVPAVLGYLFFKDRRNYDRCAVFLCTGMLIFLVISTFIPNIQHLRLHTMPHRQIHIPNKPPLRYRLNTLRGMPHNPFRHERGSFFR